MLFLGTKTVQKTLSFFTLKNRKNAIKIVKNERKLIKGNYI